MLQQVNQSVDADSPFYLGDDRAYLCWREARVNNVSPALDDLLVKINDPYQLTGEEKIAITERCTKYNVALYQLCHTQYQEKTLVHALGKQLGLQHLDANLRSDEDSVSSLQVRSQLGNQYIPYTNKALSWHTDGYYNPLDKQVFGIIMHCVRPSAEGGMNALFNPEDMYTHLRDENAAYIEALMHPQAMTIPDNIESGKVIRKAQAGPVFLLKPDGRLHMRFSARKRNIIWRDTVETNAAVEKINQLLAEDAAVFNVTMRAGQGIVCNNVLHNRTAFIDSDVQQRLMYRARYFEAVHQMNNE